MGKNQEESYLIILGDAGICWDDKEHDDWVKKELQELPSFQRWYFGHWHMDVEVNEKNQGLMEDVVCLG